VIEISLPPWQTEKPFTGEPADWAEQCRIIEVAAREHPQSRRLGVLLADIHRTVAHAQNPVLAHFIVKACNAHQELIGKLKHAVIEMEAATWSRGHTEFSALTKDLREFVARIEA